MFSLEDKIKIGSFNKAMYKEVFEKLDDENAKIIGLNYKELHNVGIMKLKFFPIPPYNKAISTGFETELGTSEISEIISEFESTGMNNFSIELAKEVSKPANLSTILEEKFDLEKKFSVNTYIRSMETVPEEYAPIQVKEISSTDNAYFTVAKSGYGIPDDQGDHFKTMNKYFYGDTTRRSFVALKNDIPLTVGQFYYNNKSSSLFAG